MEGGAGDDVYIVGNAGVSVVEAAGSGTDEVRTALATLTIASFANVENLTYTGSAAFTGTGNAANNVITGGIGNDTLIGGAGADQLIGGNGTDTAAYGSSGVMLNFKTGVHSGDAAGDVFTSIEAFRGSSSSDTFISGTGADTLSGGNGTDTIDYSTSAAGVVVDLTAGTGSGGDAEGDALTLFERVVGSAFADTLASSTSGNSLQGGGGNDTYLVGHASVSIVEAVGEGIDEVRTALSTLTIANHANVENLTYTGSAAFTGTGNSGANIITGGSGNDTLIGGAGADQVIGGLGIDTAAYLATAVTLNFKTGVHIGDAAGDSFVGIEAYRGSGTADTFVSGTGADNLNGGNGTDTIDYSTSGAGVIVNLTTGTGSGGDAEGDVLTLIERVVGSSYADLLSSSNAGLSILEGGAGDDIYVIGNVGVSAVEASNAGIDEVRTTLATFSIASLGNLEKLTYAGSASFTGTGNSANNIITGGNGSDTLIGGAGADQLIGGGGDDVASYEGSASGLVIDVEGNSDTGDAVGDSFSDIEVVRGSTKADKFVAGAAALEIDGGAGLDVLSYALSMSAITIDLVLGVNGGDATGDTYTNVEVVEGTNFADTFVGDGTSNQFLGGLSGDFIDGGAGLDTLWYSDSLSAIYANLATLTFSGGSADGDIVSNVENIIGSNFDDELFCDQTANYIEGGGGSDVIYGGLGDDTIYGYQRTQPGLVAIAPALPGVATDDVYGEGGNDEITVLEGLADGGERDDDLRGLGTSSILYGGTGADSLKQYFSGLMDGGDDGDEYLIEDTIDMATIRDTGTSGSDTVFLPFSTRANIFELRNGNDLFLLDRELYLSSGVQSGVRLLDWFAGFNTIELFVTADHNGFVL